MQYVNYKNGRCSDEMGKCTGQPGIGTEQREHGPGQSGIGTEQPEPCTGQRERIPGRIVALMNNVSACENLAAEHGLCLYVETASHRLLMDTGASPRTWENAEKLGIDCSLIDTVVISHGHYDHAGGLMSFAERCSGARIYMHRSAVGDFFHGERYIGIDKRIVHLRNICLSEGCVSIDAELSLFSDISGRRFWPEGNRALTERVDGVCLPDRFLHEQCLVVKCGGEATLLSGCAHNGILNILDRYREIYGGAPARVYSGFHMMKDGAYTEQELDVICATARELKNLPTVFYTGHCTSTPAFEIMHEIMGDQLIEIHVGDEWSF